MEKLDKQGNIFVKKEKLSLAPYHACNVLFDCFLLFLCSGHAGDELGKYVCDDSFVIGGGAMVSFITLVSGEAENNQVTLHSAGWYHFVSLAMQIRRALLQDTLGSFSWLSVITMGHLLLASLPIGLAVTQKALSLDLLGGIICATAFLASVGSSYEKHLLRSFVKSVPVLLMAVRLFSAKPRDGFTARMAIAMLICALADFILEHSFIGGLGVFLLGHLIFLFAFIKENSELAVIKGVPVFAYGISVFMVMSPKLGDLFAPVAVYILAITSMLWRVTMLGLDKQWARYVAFGALSFALSDSLIGIDKFARPIENGRFPILGLYWLGQGLIAKGTLLRLVPRPEAEADAKKAQ